MIDILEGRLPKWKADKLSIAGQIVMLISVISAMPVYFMFVFMLPKWVIKMLDKVRRGFLWHGHKGEQAMKRSLCLVNWKVVTMTKINGGLGIRNLEAMNQSLLMDAVMAYNG
jgi:hypothetical protein